MFAHRFLWGAKNSFSPFILNHILMKAMLICMRYSLVFCKRLRNSPTFELVAIIFLFLVTGCASTTQKPSSASCYQSPAEVERIIRSHVMHWEGMPHCLGGTGRNCVDCSGFVMLVYYNLFNIRLPRSTAEQLEIGRQIAKGNLQAGDVVFFLPPGKKRHVGIYLSSGEFAHVSSSKGVTISNLHDRYWRHAYWTARRILPLWNLFAAIRRIY